MTANQGKAITEMIDELNRATTLHPDKYHSAHEGLAILMEELDELKAEVWKKDKDRDPAAMREEAIQVAVVAIRFASEITPIKTLGE